jgi:superkiller protein 3
LLQQANAESLFKQVLQYEPNNEQAIVGLAQLQLDRGNLTESKQLYQRVSNNGQLGWIAYLEQDYEHAITLLKQAIEHDPKNYIHYYRLARVYWDYDIKYQQDKDYCHRLLLQSAQLYSYAPTFTLLGHLYLSDTDRAIKCYKRAIELSPLETQAGEGLWQLYVSKGMTSIAVSMAKEATKKNSRASWAWKRLGYYYQQNSLNESQQAFQHALRVNARDADCWLGLGDTYLSQGKYSASMRAYERVQEMRQDVYALAQIAHIKLLLGELHNSRKLYEDVIEQDPTYIPAYKGLVESLFESARRRIQDGVLNRGCSGLLKALSVVRAVQGTWKSFLKLEGDLNAHFYLIPDSVVQHTYEHFAVENVS